LKLDQDLLDGVSVDDFSLAFARIESHYLLNHCFLAPNQLLDNMAKIADIPGIIIQGRHDVVCPVESAWQLSRHWPKVDWRMVADGAHSMRDLSMASALVAATDDLIGHYGVY
jgi:proline iminopeptidase